jgi:osmotically-inducible protein OsmY
MDTDNEIRREVRNALRSHPDPDRKLLLVTVRSGVVTLTGWVRSYFARQRAEAITGQVPGIKGVRNLVGIVADLQIGSRQTFRTARAGRMTIALAGR